MAVAAAAEAEAVEAEAVEAEAPEHSGCWEDAGTHASRAHVTAHATPSARPPPGHVTAHATASPLREPPPGAT